MHKHRRERADSLAKNPAKEYAEFKTVYGSTKLGTLKKCSGATSLNEREALRNHIGVTSGSAAAGG